MPKVNKSPGTVCPDDRMISTEYLVAIRLALNEQLVKSYK